MQELPPEARESLYDLSPADVSVDRAFDRILGSLRGRLTEALAAAVHTAGVLLIVCVLIALSETLEIHGGAPEYVVFAGVAAIGATALSDFDSYLNRALESLQAMSDYSKVLLPTLASAAALSGSAGGAAAKYAATAFFMDLLLEAAKNIVSPCVCALAAISIADAAVGNQTLKAAKKLLRSVCTLSLTALCTAFTGYLAVSGVVAESADAVTARMTKTAVSTALPVVGGILSDAAGTLAAAAGVLRASIGVFGLAATLAMCALPFVSLGSRYLAFRLSAGLCACVADRRMSSLVEDMGTCFGMLLGLNGAGALMMFFSLYSLLRTVL